MADASPKRQKERQGIRHGERGFSLLLVVFSVTAFWQSYAISGFSGLATPGVFPMLASATMLLAATCILLQSVRQSACGIRDKAITEAESNPDILTTRLVVMVLLIAGYLIAMPAVGFTWHQRHFCFCLSVICGVNP